MQRFSESVFVADGPIVRVTRRDLDGLKGLAGDTKLRRVRLWLTRARATRFRRC